MNAVQTDGEDTLQRILLLAVSLLIAGCAADPTTAPPTTPDPPAGSSAHLELGVPVDADSTDDYLIVRYQYALSYNPQRNVPNWVSWNLNSDWYGDVPRYSGNFITDTTLPAGMYRVKHSDYTNSGFDRGHMVRSEERTRTADDNKSTFYLTNILPQRPDLNQGVWLDMEYWCESMCKDSSAELYVVAGGIYSTTTTIGNGVAVPDSCWKIVVVLPKGGKLANVSTSTRVEAVIMPNIQGVRSHKWRQYKRTVREIERATGYDFLRHVPVPIQDILENQ